MSKSLIMDISQWQRSSDIDWASASQDLAFVIIRVQYGSRTIDSEYKKHVANCKKYGIPFGHYAFGHYTSVEDAKVEARNFLNRIDKDAKFLALDVENQTVQSCGTANLAQATQAFIDVCRNAGWKTGAYISHHLYNSYGLSGVNADFLWIPIYGVNDGRPHTKPKFACDIWQYTSAGRVGWFGSNLDLDMLNGSKPVDWFTNGEVSHYTPPSTPSQPVSSGTYTVKSGDTLSVIASKLGTTVNAIARLNGISNPNVIYVGQSLKIPGSGGSPAPAPSNSSTTYTVKSGDTLSVIASKFGTTANTICQLNGISNPNVIYVGQVLKISSSGSFTASPAPSDSVSINGIKVIGRIKTTAGVLNIRSQPSGNVIGQVKKGSILPISGSVSGWWEVIYNGKRSYVSDDYANKC